MYLNYYVKNKKSSILHSTLHQHTCKTEVFNQGYVCDIALLTEKYDKTHCFINTFTSLCIVGNATNFDIEIR